MTTFTITEVTGLWPLENGNFDANYTVSAIDEDNNTEVLNQGVTNCPESMLPVVGQSWSK